jgi:hypothetical protein
VQAVEPGVEGLDPVEAHRQPDHQRDRHAEAEAHLAAREDRQVQRRAVRDDGAQQQQALARAHALAARLQRGTARHAGAPEEHAQAGVKRGGEEMK